MKNLKYGVLVGLFFVTGSVFAAQPRADKAQEAFLNAACAQEQTKSFVDQGFTVQETSTALVQADFTDEGVQGIYLVTTYLEKGDKPWNKVSTTVVGVVQIAHGFVHSANCIDPKKAALELYKLIN
ncbi:hypothetical protein [Bdellovibrio sp. HCB337]|uniref:hypothetical protein n=1 Tax=Bdellovibrio sp. HCB337 TaxID=3394358 RepID=UPI0039A6F61E